MTIKCPQCGSEQIHSDKAGFGLGKAAVGGLIVGPVGWLAGAAGRKAIVVTCLNCGHKWKAGKVQADPSAMKTCPFCAEEIKAAAVICRYCGKDQPPPPPEPEPEPPAEIKDLPEEEKLWALAAVGFRLWYGPKENVEYYTLNETRMSWKKAEKLRFREISKQIEQGLLVISEPIALDDLPSRVQDSGRAYIQALHNNGLKPGEMGFKNDSFVERIREDYKSISERISDITVEGSKQTNFKYGTMTAVWLSALLEAGLLVTEEKAI